MKKPTTEKTSWENEDGERFYIEYYVTKYYPATLETPEELPEIVISSFTNAKGEEIDDIPEKVYDHIENTI